VSEAQQTADLNDVAVAYNAYHDVNRKGPDSWDLLIELARANDGLNQKSLIRVRDAGWQLMWSERIRDLLPPDGGPTVIGTSTDGRQLCLDGTVK